MLSFDFGIYCARYDSPPPPSLLPSFSCWLFDLHCYIMKFGSVVAPVVDGNCRRTRGSFSVSWQAWIYPTYFSFTQTYFKTQCSSLMYPWAICWSREMCICICRCFRNAMNQHLWGAHLAQLVLSSSQLSAVAEITHWYQKTDSDDGIHIIFSSSWCFALSETCSQRQKPCRM